MAKSMVDNIAESYIAGLAIREKLTKYSAYELREVFNKILKCVKNHPKFEESLSENIRDYDKRILKVVYGKEINKGDIPSYDFILNSASITWGYYGVWKAEINTIGIRIVYRPEAGVEQKAFTLDWNTYSDLKSIFE